MFWAMSAEMSDTVIGKEVDSNKSKHAFQQEQDKSLASGSKEPGLGIDEGSGEVCFGKGGSSSTAPTVSGFGYPAPVAPAPATPAKNGWCQKSSDDLRHDVNQ